MAKPFEGVVNIGRDSGDSVSKEYTPYFEFTGGRIRQVEVSVGDDAYIDLERDVQGLLNGRCRR